MLDDIGVWRHGTAEINEHIMQYFPNLFTAKVDAPDLVKRIATQDMNNSLLAPYLPEEIKKALFDNGELKALGTVDLHIVFYRRFVPCLEKILLMAY